MTRSTTPATLLLLLISAMLPQAAAAVSLDEVGAGELLWKSEMGLVPLPLVDVSVDLQVTGVMNRGRVRQSFRNPTSEVIETIYVFPLPDRAAIHHMEMRIGDRRIVAEIREKAEARRAYIEARQSGRKAALLDQTRPNLFVTSAANINPGETVSVELEYVEQVSWVDGRYEMSFPLTFIPRFLPTGESPGTTGGAEHPHGEHRDSHAPGVATPLANPLRPSFPRATLTLRLRPGFELADLGSSSHALRVRREGARWIADTGDAPIPADRDVRIHWKPSLGGAPEAALLLERRGDDTYALAVLLPPIPGSEAGLGLPTETLFVVDVSGSMSGPSMRQARGALLAALGRLRPSDRFNLLAFNGEHFAFRDEFQQAEGTSLDAARDWVRSLRAGGGTRIYPALMRALQLAGESRSAHAQRIVFLTDGAVGNEQEVLRGIQDHLGDVRLHTLGIGHAPNAWLMRKMAAVGRGLCDFVSNPAELDDRIDRFLARLDRPVMTDLALSWDGVDAEEVFPTTLPDLHAGEPLVLSARLDGPVRDARLRIRGWTRAGAIEASAETTAGAADTGGIALRWARAKVESLTDGLHQGADPRDVRERVVQLAFDHHLVTRYTSLVAVEQVPTALAQALPRGGTDLRLWTGWGLALAAAGATFLLGSRWLRPS